MYAYYTRAWIINHASVGCMNLLLIRQTASTTVVTVSSRYFTCMFKKSFFDRNFLDREDIEKSNSHISSKLDRKIVENPSPLHPSKHTVTLHSSSSLNTSPMVGWPLYCAAATAYSAAPARTRTQGTKRFLTLVSNALRKSTKKKKKNSTRLTIGNNNREGIQNPDTPRRICSGSETDLFDPSNPTASCLPLQCIVCLYTKYVSVIISVHNGRTGGVPRCVTVLPLSTILFKYTACDAVLWMRRHWDKDSSDGR